MHSLIANAAACLCLLAAGVFFLTGLVTGAWKYAHMARSPAATAPVYVDIAHRASLMYSFASILLAHFAALSAWSVTTNFVAALAVLAFFAAAISTYVVHGVLRDTDNQLLEPHRLGSRTLPKAMIRGFMWSLMAAEIGGFAVLFAGVVATVAR